VISTSDANKCLGFMFERLSGKMYSMSGYVTRPDSTGSCVVSFNHNISNNRREFLLILIIVLSISDH
jgi:hypothetical protein